MQGPKSFDDWSDDELLLTTRALNTERNLVQGSIDFLNYRSFGSREHGGTDTNRLQEQIDTVVNLKEEIDLELERRLAKERSIRRIEAQEMAEMARQGEVDIAQLIDIAQKES